MVKGKFFLGCLGIVLLLTTGASQATQIRVDAGAPAKRIRMHNFWGGVHDLYFYYERRDDYKKAHDMMKAAAHKREAFKYWRCQNIFTYISGKNWVEDRVGHAYDTDKYASTGGYNWSKVDEVYDEIVNRTGLIPIVEFNYMPECMAADPTEIGAYSISIISPPRDHNEWSSLVRNTAEHFQQRYGVNETRKWYFGVWNEPNHKIFYDFPRYGYDGFLKLYDYSYVPLKQVDPNLRIGGPDNTAVAPYSRRFVEHTHHGRNASNNQIGSPAEYFSIHWYDTNVRAMATEVWKMAKDVKEVYGADADDKKILITECAAHWDMFGVAFNQNRYCAAWFAAMYDILLDAADDAGDLYLPESIHYCGFIRPMGQRSIVIQVGDEVLKTPSFNMYEAMSMLSEERIPIEGSDFPYGFLDVTDFNRKKFNQFRAIATRDPGRSVEVLLYHFNEDNRLVSNKKDERTDPAIPWGDYYKSTPNKYTVDLVIDNIPFNVGTLKKYLIDKDHSNAYAYYKVHGTLSYNTLNQHDDLEMVEEKTVAIINGRYEESVTMHENSVALYVIENESEVEMVVMPGTLTYDNTDAAQSFAIFNNGNTNLNWTAAEATASGWVTSFFPTSGTVAPQTSESVTVNIDTMGVPDGSYDSRIDITSNLGNTPVYLELQKFTPKKNFRVNVGGGAYYDAQGQEWLADQDYDRGNYGYTGGQAGSTSDPIANTSDPSLYQTERYEIPGYRFDMPNGYYDLVLHFAEIYFETAGSRVMSVSVEGMSQVTELDIYDRVGHDTAYQIELTNIPVVDGCLDLEFVASAAKTKISAIEVMENENNVDPTPELESTYRVNTGGNLLVGSDGKNWSPDQEFVTGSYGYIGGMAISSAVSITNTNDPELYQTARSTMSSYQFSVPNDQYQVVVHLAELQKSATSERLMQISIEGITKIINLDMYALVGKDVAMNLDYRDITVTDGQLEVDFSAFTSVPVVSAIEVVPMSDVTDPSPPDPPSPQSSYRINAGGDPYSDNDGDNWLADHAYVDGGYGFVGGQTAIVLDPIAQTDDEVLYQSTRSQMSAYRFDVPNDTYQVILCFSETEVDQAGARLFNIALEGQTVAVDYDIFALVGPFSAHQLEYRDVAVIDGRLDIEFENVVAGGLISGIKITDMDDVTNPPPAPVDPQSIYRINAGGNSVTDADGVEWLADHAYIDGGYGYVGGATSATNNPISGVTTQELSQTERYNMSAYRFDVPDGSYQVVFHFTEIFFTETNSRVMEIKIEGETKLSGFDVFAEGGHDVAISKEFQDIAISDGRLDIDFLGISASPQVSAIEIVDMNEIIDPPPPVEPEDVYRVNLGGQSFLDNDGHQWLQDISYIAGSYGHVDGALSLTTESITNTSLQVLYQAERYDLSEYRFDVPTGTYQVILHFAEQQFDAAGQRVFDVQLEDQQVLQNYDVFAQAGKLTAKMVEFRDVAVSDGRLDIVFSAHEATACVAGIEVVNMDEVADPDPDLPRVYRINAGGNAYSDMDSQSWLADKVYAAGSCGYIGGDASSTADMIQGTDDQPLYQTERYSQSAYRFDVPNGAYRVVLHFAEIYFEISGQRKMNILLEGMTKLSGFDIFASAGHDSATQIIFDDIPVTDGRMDVNFMSALRATKISAIEVIHMDEIGVPPAPEPQEIYRTNSGGGMFTDPDGNIWLADQPYTNGGFGYTGGSSSQTEDIISNTDLQQLYQTERFSMTDYQFDVPNGEYQVILHFAEIHFTTPGSREIDVIVEGDTLVNKLDVFALAGHDEAYKLKFRDVPVGDGVLDIVFGIVTNYPKISGIEVINMNYVEDEPEEPENVYRVNVGGNDFVDKTGRQWLADHNYAANGYGYLGGAASSTGDFVSGSELQSLFQSERYGLAGYKFDVPNGHYDITLHFAEIYFGSTNQRVMQVVIEGQAVLNDFDIFARIGHDQALSYSFPDVEVLDGRIDIEFISGVLDLNPQVTSGKSKIAGIEVTEKSINTEPLAPQLQMNPQTVYRVNAGGNTYRDKENHVWSADNAYAYHSSGFIDGVSRINSDNIAYTGDPVLYQAERQGMSAYRFDVRNGNYQIVLHFAETEYTANNRCVMQINIEGEPRVKDFDLYQRAGSGSAYHVEFSDIAVKDGRLDVEFSASTGSAKISAIEVLEMSQALEPAPSPPLNFRFILN